ncbi:uncharacterized protein Bfra_006480 [Botrytis fragariae]|uniref:Uncharacterized protein n=1 Tax=Botrytis fragariae TaxID=1964551 RepID=A0A8H6B4V2_9HELO|nr:uncharacterized protein Bfra_006480 [Botrytis fragariae]KAF5879274.1 hypothetical protein Bfra_006480 [Botrytis fragariae]
MLGVQTTNGDTCMAEDKQEADGSAYTALVAWLFLTVKPTSDNADVGKARSAPSSSEEAETGPYPLLGDYSRRLKFVNSLLVTTSGTLRHTGRTNIETVAIVGHFIEYASPTKNPTLVLQSDDRNKSLRASYTNAKIRPHSYRSARASWSRILGPFDLHDRELFTIQTQYAGNTPIRMRLGELHISVFRVFSVLDVGGSAKSLIEPQGALVQMTKL